MNKKLLSIIALILVMCFVLVGCGETVEPEQKPHEHTFAIIGLTNLKAIHLNDSMNPLGSHKDRHAKIGEGMIGLEALVRVINHPALKHLPFYLETPNELDGYAEEIRILKERYIE